MSFSGRTVNKSMDVPLLDLKAQYRTIKDEADSAVRRVTESQYFVLSGEVSSLEEEIGSFPYPRRSPRE